MTEFEKIIKFSEDLKRINTLFSSFDDEQKAYFSPLIQNIAYGYTILEESNLSSLMPAYNSFVEKYAKLLTTLLQDGEISEFVRQEMARIAAENAQDEL